MSAAVWIAIGVILVAVLLGVGLVYMTLRLTGEDPDGDGGSSKPTYAQLESENTRLTKELEQAKVNWNELRTMFFNECTEGLPLKVNMAPHDLFEWFKRNIGGEQNGPLTNK